MNKIACSLVVLVALSPLTALLPAEAETGEAPPRFGIVAHKDNTRHIDPGIATDKENFPFFPHRATTGGKKVTADMFDPPEVCGSCHTEIYKQWKGSMHSNAWTDPIYRAVLNEVSETHAGKVDNFCMGCHTPVGIVTGEATPSGEGMSAIADRGVQCDVCHNISDSLGIGNGAFVLTPELHGRPLKFGPFDDAVSPYHDTAYSPLHTRSEFCGQCHNVTHPFNKLPIERTYDEWRDSPYAGKGIQCQDCHMKPVRGRATPFSKEREKIYTHYFVGGNVMVPRLLGSEMHARLAEEMLRSAAEVEILAPDVLVAGEMNKIRVRVTNVGAGHKLPTGFPEGREMWLDLRVIDESGKTVYRLGAVEDGFTEKGTKNFKVVLADKDGNIVELDPIEAERILYDTRILPQGYADAVYDVRVPADAHGKRRIVVDLNYWSFPQGFLDHLMGDDAPRVPITRMTRATTTVRVAPDRAVERDDIPGATAHTRR